MGLVENITARRKALGMSEQQMLRSAGLGSSLMKDLRRQRARSVRTDTLRRLAAVLQCTLDELAPLGTRERDEAEYESDMKFSRSGEEPAAPPAAPRQAFLMIPEYDVRVAAGGGTDVDREDVRGFWPFTRVYLDELRLAARDLAIVEIVGDSMEPTLRSGDRVMIDTSDKRIGIPGVFAVWDGDGLVAKRIERVWAAPDDSVRLRLISDNAQHMPYEVAADWVNVVGRVVWYARRM